MDFKKGVSKKTQNNIKRMDKKAFKDISRIMIKNTRTIYNNLCQQCRVKFIIKSKRKINVNKLDYCNNCNRFITDLLTEDLKDYKEEE